MIDGTIGQRIAQQRKKLGLSQEALGDKLMVSRQAISKWESDAAIPEVDKLIALSRLFDVTIGWLLGVEEQKPNQEEALSESQLKLVEELVRKYQLPPAPRLSIFHYLFAIFASLLIFLFLYGQTSQIQRMLENTVSISEYNALSARVAILEEHLGLGAQVGGALTADYSFSISQGKDLRETSRAELRFRAMPIQWEAGDTAYLAVRRNNQEVCRQECTWDGERLHALLYVEMEDGYEYALFIHHADGIRQQQMLYNEAAQNLRSQLAISLTAEPGHYNYKNGVLTLTGYHVHARQPENFFGMRQWTVLDFVLYRNGEELGRDTMLDALVITGESISCNSEIDIRGHLIQFRDLDIREGDTLKLCLQAQLSSGESSEISVQTFLFENSKLTAQE